MGIVGYLWSINRGWSYVIRCDHGKGKNKTNYLNSLIPWGVRVPVWKISFCYRFLRLSVLPPERPQVATFWLEWFARLKLRTMVLMRLCLFFQHLKDVQGNGCLVFGLFRLCITLYIKHTGDAMDDIAGFPSETAVSDLKILFCFQNFALAVRCGWKDRFCIVCARIWRFQVGLHQILGCF